MTSPLASSPAVRAMGERLAGVARNYVSDSSGRVRVEDYLAVLASVTGEAAIVASGVFDIEAGTITPGSAVFGDAINAILTGDSADQASLPPDSVLGILVAELVPAVIPVEFLPPIEDLYRQVAATVGATSWGEVDTTVPVANQPRVLPIRAAFEMRTAVEVAQQQAGLPIEQRHVPCALALAHGLAEVREVIDMRMAVRLALEVTFGMAKMAPMSRAAFASVAGGKAEA